MVENYQQTVCRRKREFSNARLAREAARGYRSRKNFKKDMKPYRCAICGKWHLTTTKKKKKQKSHPIRKRHEADEESDGTWEP